MREKQSAWLPPRGCCCEDAAVPVSEADAVSVRSLGLGGGDVFGLGVNTAPRRSLRGGASFGGGSSGGDEDVGDFAFIKSRFARGVSSFGRGGGLCFA